MKKLAVFILFCLFGFFSTNAKTYQILFVGNSYTYRNHMPRMFEKIAISNGKNVKVYWNTKGKTSFFGHSKRKELFQAIRWKKWDYVLLQGSSRDMLKEPKIFFSQTIPGLKKIIYAIHTNHPKTKILFYMTWGYKRGYGKIQHAKNFHVMTHSVRKGYEYLSHQMNVPIVPVGVAWIHHKKAYKTELHHPDGAHPNEHGSYLAACCFYTSIFKEEIKIHPRLFNVKSQQKLGNTAFETVSNYDYSTFHFEETRKRSVAPLPSFWRTSFFFIKNEY